MLLSKLIQKTVFIMLLIIMLLFIFNTIDMIQGNNIKPYKVNTLKVIGIGGNNIEA